MTALRLVATTPDADETLRQMIIERDRLAASLSTLDRLIADQSRNWADARGLMVRPRIEQLRRELGL